MFINGGKIMLMCNLHFSSTYCLHFHSTRDKKHTPPPGGVTRDSAAKSRPLNYQNDIINSIFYDSVLLCV